MNVKFLTRLIMKKNGNIYFALHRIPAYYWTAHQNSPNFLYVIHQVLSTITIVHANGYFAS